MNEGFIDDVKRGAKRVGRSIKNVISSIWDNIKKIEGRIYATINGKPIPANTPINCLVATNRGEAPVGTCVILPESEIDFAKENGVNVKNGTPDDIVTDDDYMVDSINEFWYNVIHNLETKDVETVKESYNITRKQRHRMMIREGITTPRQLKALNEALNEANLSLEATESMGGIPNGGIDEIIETLADNIYFRMNMDYDADMSNKHRDPLPLLIWGAPGIGKTQVVEQCIERCLTDETIGKKLAFVDATASRLLREDFTLPIAETTKTSYTDSEGKTITTEKIDTNDVPKGWLPMYRVTGDPEVDRAANDAVNGINGHEGGVIFFDEISRMDGGALSVLMTLLQSRTIGNYRLGSKWIFAAAANRFEDMGEYEQNRFSFDEAQAQRFQHINFVPKFEDWLKWAEKHGIEKEIIRFLESNPDMWYDLTEREDDVQVSTRANPRSWADVSDTIQNMRNRRGKGFIVNDDVYKKTISRVAGTSAANRFLKYREDMRAVSPEIAKDIWAGKNSKLVKDFPTDTNNVQNANAVISGLVSNYPGSEKDNASGFTITSEQFENLAKFVVDRFGNSKSVYKYAVNYLVKTIANVSKDDRFLREYDTAQSEYVSTKGNGKDINRAYKGCKVLEDHLLDLGITSFDDADGDQQLTIETKNR